MSSADRAFYSGKTLEHLEDAKLGLETIKADIEAAMITHRARITHGRVAEHEEIWEGLEIALYETKAALDMIQDVIDSGETADAIEEAQHRDAVARGVRASQV